MASSDEEGEILPRCVTNYYFVDYKGEPISFSILPLQWSEDENPDGLKMLIFLRGSADDGLQTIYKQVIAWKFELSNVQPEIFVLSKDKNWMELQSPRKSFQNIVRKIVIAVFWLHFVKNNPEASGKATWNHLQKSLSLYEVEPSENDLFDHMPLICEAAKRDEDLLKSKYMLAYLLEKSGKETAFYEDVRRMKKYKFIVDEDDNDEDEENDEDKDEFDSVCAICDNGGELLCCEGRCIRSFHATIDAGVESLCESLGYSEAQVEAIQDFLCKNCQYQQHQCFVCGMLGSSNDSSGAEVFRCESATCGRFYHPDCVARLLHPANQIQAKELQNKIAAGNSFTCPAHKCFTCKRGENKRVYDLQFALCRRCPKAYHRKCLPRKIAFQSVYSENIVQRAWDGLIPNRILIYCMEHKISGKLGTPERNHIIFPDPEGKGKKHVPELLSSKEKVTSNKRSMVSEILPAEITGTKMPKFEVQRVVIDGSSTKNFEKRCSSLGFDSPSKWKTDDATKKFLEEDAKSISVKAYESVAVKEIQSSVRNYKTTMNIQSSPIKAKQQNTTGKVEKIISLNPVTKRASPSQPLVEAELETRIAALMKSSTSSFNFEEFREKQKGLCARSCTKNLLDKTITQGKVEAAVKAVRTALEKLENGCSIEDAKAVCEPEVLNQIVRWKKKLKVYLAPVLHGMRYTSFGRHFTKVEKLREVVDRLHWYVQNGDMIVDFCCGSNDFSLLMKDKLENTGKRCLFKNYDLIQPKNDFSFEKRDWMSIHLDELPTGSQLIMGLNPPFGVKASLANKFINKALNFKPKLLILIVPKETERLDEKDSAYDLIWEDEVIFSGKSFYLPGSVDVHDKQLEQWNLMPPPLYLWSRPDWTSRHKEIAQMCGHLPLEQNDFHLEENDVQREVSNYLMEENHDCYGDFSNLMNDYRDISSILDDVPEANDESEPEGTRMSIFGPSTISGSCEGWKKNRCGMEPSTRQLMKMQCEGMEDIDQVVTSTEENWDGEAEPGVNGMCIDMELSSPTNSPFNCTDLQSLLGDKAGESQTSEIEVGKTGFGNLEPKLSGNNVGFKTKYVGMGPSIPSKTDGQNLTNKEPFPIETHILSTQANLGFNGQNQSSGYINPGMGIFGGPSYVNTQEKQRSVTNSRADLSLSRQNADVLSQGSILPNPGSGFYPVGSLPHPPVPIGSAAQPSYIGINYSVMQQYGPRPQESNVNNEPTTGNHRPPW